MSRLKNTFTFEGANVLMYVNRAPQAFLSGQLSKKADGFQSGWKNLSNRQECTIPTLYKKGSEIYNTWKRMFHLNGNNMLKPIDWAF